MGTKWLGIYKGDEEIYNIGSRVVAQEFTKGDLDNISFAATPPWEAKKMLLTLAVTDGIGHGSGWHYKVDVIDIKRAYLYTPAQNKRVHEITHGGSPRGNVWELGKSLYWTRGASLNWEGEEEYVRFMVSIGPIRGQSSSCSFYYPVELKIQLNDLLCRFETNESVRRPANPFTGVCISSVIMV